MGWDYGMKHQSDNVGKTSRCASPSAQISARGEVR